MRGEEKVSVSVHACSFSSLRVVYTTALLFVRQKTRNNGRGVLQDLTEF